MTSKQLKLLVETVQQLSLARDIETIMDVVRKTARKLTGADGATFVLRDRDLCYYADEDAIGPLWKGQRFPMSSCISGWAMIHKKPAVVQNIYTDDRIPIEAYKPTFVKSLITVPIRSMDPVGAIGNYWAKQHNPTDEEIELLQSLADITSVSIENVYVYNELEQRVKERTEQLMAVNEELEAFSHSIAHDLRAPLRTITGRLSILQEDYSGHTEAQNLIESIIAKANGMNELIHSLLNFSRLGKKDLSYERISMAEMVEEICESLIEQEEGRDISCEIHQLPPTMGDPVLIKQVWVNLISNAIKYTGNSEKAEILIGGEASDSEITYFVKDNGAGFDMQYYDQVFGIFQRLHSESEFKGYGIGLALVHRILLRHGGKIWAEGKVNEGAQFYFTLPKEKVIKSAETV
ncbi:Osmosensitive K+ channel histidine kinase KdpD [Fulvivirga imtechensis AK7]|uniref:histidine kinase n=1 Tax=Fulvivirga imtechensis AK7 TaxID=1237149 RepID=M0QSW9_9BACT|nr:ATP-binding protein [Fulvivirga imtechensis]ELR72012.1 Osmosensitive K+ channel histidine kinase KdpD [Fulvivirga imtechensis AK7]